MDYGKRPPLDEQKSLWEATVAAEGVTTSAGEGTGLSFIASGLAGAGANSFVSMMAIIHPGDPAQVDSKDVTAFNTGTGEVTVASAFKGGQVAAGVPYKIITFRFVPAEVAAMDAKIGTAVDNADLGTLFARHRREFLGSHTHALVVVHDTSALDADLDTALHQWLLDIGFIVTLADPTDVAGNLDLDNFTLVIVSASCVAADVGNLANLNTIAIPVVCHSADIAASAVFDMGGTPHTQAGETQIEITDNTPMWLITTALGDLTVTASTDIYAMNTKTADAVTLAEEATGTGNHLTIVKLSAGEDNEAGYAAFYDRYFIGVGDYTNINAVWLAVMEDFFHHLVHDKRYAEDVVQAKGVYQEDIPDTDFALAVIDNALTNPPPAADAENSIVDIDQRNHRTFVLRSLWVNVTNFGGGTQLTFQLWVPLNGVVTSVDSVVVNALGIQNLMDLFGLPEVHADGIWITAITDAGATGACSGTYRYAEAKK